MTKIVIKTTHDIDQVNNYVDEMRDRVEDFKPVFEEMKDYLSNAWQRNFETNGSSVGGWAPLDPEYGSWKSVHFPGAPPMIRSGELFRSLGSLRGRENEINERSAQFGTNIEYAKFHQYGTSKMPKREIIFEPDDFARKWGNALATYVIDNRVDRE